MIGSSIYTLLAADATVTGYVPSTKIMPVRAIQETQNPCIIYNTRTIPEDHKDGVSVVKIIDVDIDVYSDSYDQMENIRDAIITVLDHYAGTVGNQVLSQCILASHTDMYDDIAESFRSNIVFRVRLLDIAVAQNFLLLQTGDFLLLQTGGKLVLQS